MPDLIAIAIGAVFMTIVFCWFSDDICEDDWAHEEARIEE
jgi:hypothetical protein